MADQAILVGRRKECIRRSGQDRKETLPGHASERYGYSEIYEDQSGC